MKAITHGIALLGAVSLWTSGAVAQDNIDVSDCALDCVSNVNGTDCAQAQFSCLCKDQMYIDRLNDCAYKACNKTEEDATFSAVAGLCAIFSITLTVGPEATASIITSDQIFNTQGVASASSLPPTLATSDGSPTPASTNAPSSITQGSSSAPAAATSNAAVQGAPARSPNSLILWLLACVGGCVGAF